MLRSSSADPSLNQSLLLCHYYSNHQLRTAHWTNYSVAEMFLWIISFFSGYLKYSMCRFYLHMSWLLLPNAPTDCSLLALILLRVAFNSHIASFWPTLRAVLLYLPSVRGKKYFLGLKDLLLLSSSSTSFFINMHAYVLFLLYKDRKTVDP